MPTPTVCYRLSPQHKTACGNTAPEATSRVPRAVTCEKCRHTDSWKTAYRTVTRQSND